MDIEYDEHIDDSVHLLILVCFVGCLCVFGLSLILVVKYDTTLFEEFLRILGVI